MPVRPARPDDIDAILGLYNRLIRTDTVTWRDEEASGAELAAWFDRQAAEGNPVLVAEVDGAVVGYVTWSGFRGVGGQPNGYRHSKELTIHVDGAQHGRGIGRALLEALLAEAAVRGVHVLVAGVDAANDGSIRFHEALGFIEVARMPEVGRKFDRWLDLVLLQRIVG